MESIDQTLYHKKKSLYSRALWTILLNKSFNSLNKENHSLLKNSNFELFLQIELKS